MENQVLEVSLDSTCIYRCSGCSLGEKKEGKIDMIPRQVIDTVDVVYRAFPKQPFSLEINTPMTSYRHLTLPEQLLTGAQEINLSLGIINGNDDHDLSIIRQVSSVSRVLREIQGRCLERIGVSFGASTENIENIVTISYLLALEVARQKVEGNLNLSETFDIAYSENNVASSDTSSQRFRYVAKTAQKYLRDIFSDNFREISGGIAITETNIGVPINTSYATGGGHGIGFHALYQRHGQKEPKRIGITIDHRFLHLPQGFGKHIEPELIEQSKAEGLANIMVTPTKVHLLHSSTNMRMSAQLALNHDEFTRKIRTNTMPYVDFIHSLVDRP